MKEEKTKKEVGGRDGERERIMQRIFRKRTTPEGTKGEKKDLGLITVVMILGS